MLVIPVEPDEIVRFSMAKAPVETPFGVIGLCSVPMCDYRGRQYQLFDKKRGLSVLDEEEDDWEALDMVSGDVVVLRFTRTFLAGSE